MYALEIISINKLLLPAKCVTWLDGVRCALRIQVKATRVARRNANRTSYSQRCSCYRWIRTCKIIH